VLVQVDTAVLPALAPALAETDARVVVYCPVDWPDRAPSLEFADDVVAYTEYGRSVLGGAAAVIPHGVDTARVTPAERDDDEFVVLNANRNIRRKRADLTLEGFALFARDRPRARLHLHMGPRDGGYPLHALAAELGIADRVALTPSGDARRPKVDDAELARIYGRAHVGLNTCDAEGFGLVAFEHAATGAPQVLPGHSACGELWRGHAVLTPERTTPEDVAAALARLHDDPGFYAEMAGRALARARDPRFDWDVIARQWEELLAAPSRVGRAA